MNNYYQMLRRRFYKYFRKGYIEKSIKNRKGQCNRCSCCEVVLFCKKYECKYFEKETKSCMIYNTKKMPPTCYYYPFDEKDKWSEFRDRCGFFWEKGKSK